MSKRTIKIESEIAGLTKDNILSKLSPHFHDIIEEIEQKKLENVHITTTIKHLSERSATMLVEVQHELEQLRKLRK